MTQVSPDMVEVAARAIYEGRNGKGCKPWSLQTKAHKDPYILDATAALTAALGDTHVIVPKEAMSFAHQMANLCSNLKQNPIFTERYRKNMDECQSGFDAALSPASTPEQQQP